MNSDNLYRLVARLFSYGAFLLFALAVIEVFANFSNYTILPASFSTGRLLEASVVLLVFVISILLRQIRDALRAKG